MTFNNIQPGDLGLSSKAMENWRHVGRLNQALVPYDTSGNTITVGTLDIGASLAPWKDIYLATGSSIFVGGSAFEGGGGGSVIEVFEQQSHLEKAGINYPLSNPQTVNESFTDDTAMVVTLGKTHAAASTTIYLDRDAESISAIDEASATAWTPVNTGTTATNTTADQSVDGTSVKYSVTATNTTYYMAQSFTTFSMADQDLKVWLHPDVVANITSAMVRLYSAATTTGYAEWQIPVASLTVATLNSLYLDVGNPGTSGAEYARNSINYVGLGAIGSATPQAIEWSWDKLRRVSNHKLKLPVQLVCDNNTNQEFINVVTTTVAGDVYTLDTATTYSHTISSTEIKLKQLTIANNQGVINSTAAGDASLVGWDISRQYMDTSTSGDLVLTSRWYDENYPIATTTSNSATVLTVETTTVAAGYKSGDVVRLYNYEYIDNDYQSIQNASIGSNFIDLTLTADGGTTSSTELTLTHANTSNQNLGGDQASAWRGVRASVDDYYRVEGATDSQSLVKAPPTRFIVNENTAKLFEDDFNRANDNDMGNGWTVVNAQNYGWDHGVYNNEFSTDLNASPPDWDMTVGYRQDLGNLDRDIEIQFDFHGGVAGDKFQQGISLGALIPTNSGRNWNNYNTGIYAVLRRSAWSSSTYNELEIGDSTGIIGTFVPGLSANSTTMHRIKIQVLSKKIIQVRYWTPSIEDEPTTWNHKVSRNTGLTNTNNFRFCFSNEASNENGGSGECGNDNFIISTVGGGFIQKSTIADTEGIKLITATRLTRSDATNQDPIVYQRNAAKT